MGANHAHPAQPLLLLAWCLCTRSKMGGYLSKGMEGMMKEMTKENQEFMLKAQAMQVSPTKSHY